MMMVHFLITTNREQVLRVGTSALVFLQVKTWWERFFIFCIWFPCEAICPGKLFVISWFHVSSRHFFSQLTNAHTHKFPHTPPFILLPQTVYNQSEVRKPTARVRPKLNESRFSACVRGFDSDLADGTAVVTALSHMVMAAPTCLPLSAVPERRSTPLWSQ